MRRVYYAYALGVATHPMLLHGMALSVSLGLFAHLVHVRSLLTNLLNTELGNIPVFIYNAFARGEVLTILAVGVMIFTALSVQWRLFLLPIWRRLAVVTRPTLESV